MVRVFGWQVLPLGAMPGGPGGQGAGMIGAEYPQPIDIEELLNCMERWLPPVGKQFAQRPLNPDRVTAR